MKAYRSFFIVSIVAILVGWALFLVPSRLRDYQEQRLYPHYAEGLFGGSGVVNLQALTSANAVLLSENHKVLVGGSASNDEFADFALVRILNDGTKDPTFGKAGLVQTDFSGDDLLQGLAVQGEGKILAVGACKGKTGRPHPCVARYLDNGSLDASFGSSGLVSLPLKEEGGGKSVAFVDGKILVAGTVLVAKQRRFAIWRLLANGAPDPSFGLEGQVTSAFGRGNAELQTFALQAGSHLVLAGYVQEGRDLSFALARYGIDGTPDPSFGDHGLVKTPFLSSSNYLHALLLEPGGKIIIAGSSGVTVSYDAALARFGVDGRPDLSFGFNGITVTPLGTKDDEIRGIHLLPSGKILAVASAEIDSMQNATVLCRYLANGNLDSSYGEEGVTLPLSGNLTINASALQSNGKVLVVGRQIGSKKEDFGGYVARFTLKGKLDGK